MAEYQDVDDLIHRNRQLEEENARLKARLAEKSRDEERFRAILNAMQEGYFEVDLQGNFTYFSPAIPEIFGYAPEEIIGMNNRQYTTPETAKKMFRIFNRVYRTGEPAEITDYEIFQKDGSRRYMELSAYRITDASGRPTGFRGLCRDVTERKKIEKALAESEARFRRLHEASFGGIGIHDRGRIIDCNRGLAEMTGYTYDELIGMDGLQLIAPEWRETVMEKIVSDYETAYTAEGLRKDGTRYPLEIMGKVIQYEGRKYRVTEFRDISERKRAEEALRESEQRYRSLYKEAKRAEELYQSLLNSSPDAIVIYNMDQTVRYVNPVFTEIFGWTLDELLDHPIDHVPEEEQAAAGQLIENLLTEGKTLQGIETRRKTRAGHLLDVSISAACFHDYQDEPAGILIILRDITEAKKLRRHLQQAQKMESVGTLAGGIAHDFNNLLMGMQGRLSLMMFDLSPSHSHYRHVQEIENYVKRAAELTQQLLGFARGGKYEVVATDINELIRTHNRMFGRTRKDISIHENFGDDLNAVEVDQRQIEQVLLNIYVNAGHAMPEGGCLYVSTGHERLWSHRTLPHDAAPGDYVKISITDTGEGMEERVRRRVFEPFFTTREMGRGTGLGLASAYGIIRNHHGFITVYSEPGKGTTFNIYLPASRKTPAAEKSGEDQIVSGKGTVLLVDDESMIVEVGQELIESLGYNVKTAAGGAEAIEVYKAEQEEIDLVILDMIMPGVSGGETFDRLRAINPDAKILLASGYSLNGQAADILERGCNGFIQKPYNLLDLSRKIADIVSGSS
ncbi:MAG: PAS domain-containing hybrid sensor histidine kinase/response regulator [Thermodesulfobacteriota bacterium]